MSVASVAPVAPLASDVPPAPRGRHVRRALRRAAARALGFAGVELVDAALVSSNPRMPVAMARAAPMLAGDAAALPVEPGRSQVSVGFNATFRLRRSP